VNTLLGEYTIGLLVNLDIPLYITSLNAIVLSDCHCTNTDVAFMHFLKLNFLLFLSLVLINLDEASNARENIYDFYLVDSFNNAVLVIIFVNTEPKNVEMIFKVI